MPETLYTIDPLTGARTFVQTLGNGADGEVIGSAADGTLYHGSGGGTVVTETTASTGARRLVRRRRHDARYTAARYTAAMDTQLPEGLRPRPIAARLLAGAALVVLLIAATAFGLSLRYPCWRYSNASWCGHYCDDDPCACPERDTRADPYGAGPGCVP